MKTGAEDRWRKTRGPAAAADRTVDAHAPGADCTCPIGRRAESVRPTGWPAGRGGRIGGSSVVYSVARAHKNTDALHNNRDIIVVVVVVLSREIKFFNNINIVIILAANPSQCDSNGDTTSVRPARDTAPRTRDTEVSK